MISAKRKFERLKAAGLPVGGARCHSVSAIAEGALMRRL
jgi:hypothetical protein